MISVTTINSLLKSIWYQLVPSCTEENIVRLIVSLEKEPVCQHGIDTTKFIRIWLVVLHLDEVSMRLWTLFYLCSFIRLPLKGTNVRTVNDFFPGESDLDSISLHVCSWMAHVSTN
jgi:hypothetical protein